ncbi:DUF4337 domain-containing protein [Leeia oryzae]|uniref:DUF4337 domain-containing protein n=1 Tax=Leeia oryzae TaxID=356662 RepID=UPI00037EF4B1|nr:DUF4337 domain-containing protein [Leeia oryzae]
MSDDKKEPWLNFLALTTVIFAVCATLSTFKGGGYSTRSVISQAQASDQWAYYQAKSIRETLYKIQRQNLTLTRNDLASQHGAPDLSNYDAAIAEADKTMNRYKDEKDTIQKDAKALEAKRDDAQRHGQPFGLAVIFFQVAILLSSIAGLFKQKSLWYLALPVGGVGLVYFFNGFWLFM